MIFFAAMRSNELGKTIGGQVEKVGENVFRTMPILKIGWSWVGVGSAYNVLKWVPDRWINDKNSEQTAIANKYVYGSPDKWTPPTTIDSGLATTLITSNATTDSIKKWLTDKWVKEADISTVIGGSTENIWAAINKLNLAATKSDELAKAVNVASNNKLGDNWYTTYEANQKTEIAKTNLENVIKITTKTTTTTDIDKLIAKNLTIVDAYFATWAKEYTKVVEGTTFKIAKDTSNKYVVSTATEAPKPTEAKQTT